MRNYLLVFFLIVVLGACENSIELNERDLISLYQDPVFLMDFLEKWEFKETNTYTLSTIYQSEDRQMTLIITKGGGYSLIVQDRDWKDLDIVLDSLSSHYSYEKIKDPTAYQHYFDTLEVTRLIYFYNDTTDILFGSSDSTDSPTYMVSYGETEK
jgi:hypothetical protein